MPTQITQKDFDGSSYLRVEGEMLLDDALLVEKIAGGIRASTGRNVIVDLADLSFLDSESASVIKRIENNGITVEGLEIFLQSAIDSAERNEP